MSKKNTKEIIFDQALKMFNEQGIEYVGVREIATALGLRVGNVTYYYPTKDDLVAAITERLSEANSSILAAREDLTMEQFLDIYAQAFANHYRYRCLFISFVHMLEQNKKVEAIYMPTQEKRYKTIRHNLHLLMENGYLQKDLDTDDINYLVSSVSLISRFWLSEARVRFRGAKKQQLFQHYLSLFAMHFKPYATKAGKEQIRQFIHRQTT